jgi:hypothetical protein
VQLEMHREIWVSKGCSIVMDGWTDICRHRLINIILPSSAGPLYHNYPPSLMKSAVKENLILHNFVTLNSTSLFTHLSKNGEGWSPTSNPKLFTKSSAMILACEQESYTASTFVFLTCIMICQSLVISFSSL